MIPSRILVAAAFLLALSGCGSEVLSPSGDVAVKLRDVLGITTALILVIVLPVMVTTVIFALRYRKSDRESRGDYDPHFHHSTSLELLIWAAPLAIIIWLGALTWVSTHKLDPYRPLNSETAGVTADAEPLIVEVVSMDWKWLFFYPQYGIATVNELAAPVDRPISFRLTSTEVMNAFYVPTLAGMIYTMPSMQTQLHAVINAPGTYKGMSSHYSGAGFSGMNFPFYGMDQAGFDAWIDKARASGQVLDRDRYRTLLKPSENEPAALFTLADETLYHDILNRCVEPGQTCMDAEMAGHGDMPAHEMQGHDMPAQGMPDHGGATDDAAGSAGAQITPTSAPADAAPTDPHANHSGN